jgi:cytochrome oxidase assembly protein ShyY1
VVSSPELLSRWEGQLWQGFVVLQAQDPDDPNAIEPVKQPAATQQSISWQSLAYAVQWWLFAAFAGFFYWRMLSLEYETTMGSASDPAERQA